MKTSKAWWAGVIFGMVLSLSLLIYGCAHVKPVETPAGPKEGIAQVQKDVGRVADTLENTTAAIKKDATDGQKATPPQVRPTLDPFWNGILGNAGVQDDLVRQLRDKDSQFESLKQQSDQLKKFGLEQKARAEKAEQALQDQTRRNLQYLIFFGIIGIAVGGALVFSGYKFGMAIGVGSAIVTAISLVVTQMLPYIPWIVGGLVVVCVGMAIWAFIKHQQEKKAQVQALSVAEKATKQLVQTVENTKQLMTVKGRKKLFGDGALVGLANFIQDEQTRAIVAKHRESIAKAPSIPVNPAIDMNGDGVIDERDVEIKPMKQVRTQRFNNNDEDIWTAHMA